jgi:hypothetical protein
MTLSNVVAISGNESGELRLLTKPLGLQPSGSSLLRSKSFSWAWMTAKYVRYNQGKKLTAANIDQLPS